MSDWDDDDWGSGWGDSVTQDKAPASVPQQQISVPDNIRFGRGSRGSFGDVSTHRESNDSHTLMVDCSMCGKIIGKRGSMIRELEEKSGARIKVIRDKEQNFKVPIIVSGGIQEREVASHLIKELLKQSDSVHRNDSYADDSTVNFHRQHFRRTVTREQKTMKIKSSCCGKVIGRGGSKIKELQDDSGAGIIVKSNDGDGDTTPVLLIGTQDQIEKAETMIEELLDQNPQVSGVVKSNDSGGKMDGFTSTGLIDWANVNNMCREQSKKRWENAVPIRKIFYIEDGVVGDMLPIEVEEWREENFSISVTHLVKGKPSMILNPVLTFEQAFKHYPEVLETIYAQGFSKPSPIQSQAWPLVLNGFDVIGIAQTGTGKTLAFLLPAFIHIDGQSVPRSERKGPTCLILTPTRELALQIEMEIKKYHYRGIRCVCVYGGGDRRKQINLVTNGVEIIVATPGRFNDLLANEIVTLDSVTFLVLDEADRMLDMGFEPQIMKILLDIRPDRQTIMTSATWPEGVRRLARSYLTDPMQVAVGSLDLAAVHTVTQIVEVIAQEEKRDRLLDFIHCMEPNDKVLVFVGRKTTADDLSADLCMRNIVCQSIHGGREQYDREQALDDFKTGAVHILVATDVASRGLDVADITHVFNYDYPRNTEEYVHRVGRTGRAGKSGTSITLVTREDWSTAKELIDILVEAQQDVPIELYDMAERYTRMKERRERENGFRGGRRGGFRRNNNRW